MYQYEKMRPEIFTEDGQKMFLEIYKRVQKLLKTAGAFNMDAAIKGITGDVWKMLACVDRMVELGEIREVTDPDKCSGQGRVFVKGHNLIVEETNNG